MKYPFRTRDQKNHKEELSRIAVGVMIVRGLEPEFPAAVIDQLNEIQGPAKEQDASIVDLRGLPWCSIDNDDSRDLDQLTVLKASSGEGYQLLLK